MKRTIFALLVGSLVSLASVMPVWAHHSFAAAYDMTASSTLKGVIYQVRIENPHSWFFVDVKDANGKTERWAFEAGTPSAMIRNGYKPGEIKAGVAVTIKYFHARDASAKAGMLDELTTPDGKTYGKFGPVQGSGQ